MIEGCGPPARTPDDRPGRAAAGCGFAAGRPRRRGLSGRSAAGHGAVPRGPDGPAPAARGRAWRRQARGREGAGRGHRHAADQAAVLRGPDVRGGALRVELPAAAARHPAGRGQGRDAARGGPVRTGVPARAVAAGRDRASGTAPGGAADRRGRPGRRRVRGVPVRAAGRVRGDHSRARHAAGGVSAGRGADLEPHPRPARRPEAALPVPLDRLPGRRAGRGDHTAPGARGGDPARRAGRRRRRPAARSRPGQAARRRRGHQLDRGAARAGRGEARRGRGGADRGRRAQVRRGPSGRAGQRVRRAGHRRWLRSRHRWGRAAMAEPRALPPPVPGGDLAEVVARFRAGLRRAGLPVGPGRCERFASAVTLARPRTPDALYLCALATLVSGRDQIEILQGVFNQVFGGLTDPAGRRGDQDGPAPARPSTPEDLLAQAAQAAKAHVSDSRLAATPGAGPDGADRDHSSEPEREIEHRYLGSTVERLAGPALQRAGEAAPDWLGGTRIGASIKEFNDVYGRRGMARGAIIVIISDGWDTGDPEVLRREMERLSLVAFRIVWVNPRTKSTSYQPLAGGMAAAWPHCDAVVSAHTLAALDQLTASLADPVRPRAPVRTPLTPPAPGPHPIRSHAAGEKRLAAVGLAFLVSDEYAPQPPHAPPPQP